MIYFIINIIKINYLKLNLIMQERHPWDYYSRVYA